MRIKIYDVSSLYEGEKGRRFEFINRGGERVVGRLGCDELFSGARVGFWRTWEPHDSPGRAPLQSVEEMDARLLDEAQSAVFAYQAYRAYVEGFPATIEGLTPVSPEETQTIVV